MRRPVQFSTTRLPELAPEEIENGLRLPADQPVNAQLVRRISDLLPTLRETTGPGSVSDVKFASTEHPSMLSVPFIEPEIKHCPFGHVERAVGMTNRHPWRASMV